MNQWPVQKFQSNFAKSIKRIVDLSSEISYPVFKQLGPDVLLSAAFLIWNIYLYF